MTRPMHGRRLPAAAWIGVLVIGFMLPSGVNLARPMPARAVGDLLPDLAMAPLSDFRIQSVNGRRLLRFTASMVNIGQGHFELRGRRATTSDPMRMTQVLYASTSHSAPSASIFSRSISSMPYSRIAVDTVVSSHSTRRRLRRA